MQKLRHRIRSRLLPVLTGLLGFLFISGSASAQSQDIVDRVTATGETVIVYQDISIEPGEENEETVAVLRGRTDIYRADMYLRIDGSVVMWLPPGSTLQGGEEQEDGRREMTWKSIRGVYAEGKLLAERENSQVFLERLFFQPGDETGVLFNARFRMKRSDGTPSFQVRADQIKSFVQDTFIAEDASATTCEFNDPHYDVLVRRLEFTHEGDGVGQFSMTHVIPRYRGIPFFYWPWYSGRTDRPPLLRSVSSGDSRRLGRFWLTEWGITLFRDRDKLEENGEVQRRSHSWMDIRWEIDDYTERGTAYGLDLDYEWVDYRGFVDTYFLEDEGPRNGDNIEPGLIDGKDRWRLHQFHRQGLGKGWLFETEVNYLSDEKFLQSFFEDEFKEDKEPESYGRLLYREGPLGLELIGQWRENGHQTQTEHLPHAHGWALGIPVPGVPDIVLFSEAQGGRVRRRVGERLVGDDYAAERGDARIEAVGSWGYWGFKISPFGAARFTRWSGSAADEEDPIERIVTRAGVHGEFLVAKPYDVDFEDVGIYGLRHLTGISAQYTNNLQVTQGRTELLYFDDVELVEEFEEVAVYWVNRFQTKDGVEPDATSHEFLLVSVGLEFYPDRSRDTDRFVRQSGLFPFNPLILKPSNSTVQFKQRDFTNLNYEIVFTPRDLITLRAEGDVDIETDESSRLTLDASLKLIEGMLARFNHFVLEDVTRSTRVRLSQNFGENWQFGVETQYDWVLDEFAEQEYTVSRKVHDFVLTVSYLNDESRDDRVFSISLSPKFLPSSVFGEDDEDDRSMKTVLK